ncbi:hypothetical protein BU24DRAFT_168205 [Aaosphaeria arxii CBS 175.79]|uniref:Receptor-activated Ca2+-permeable cation channel n=1 Tax=Aaosphaeria arxii CBS 175.79 TaxID=1450172 RepID=A0A6A5XYB5_9PLEO|nr:uncharacterized protein BU24DRAFT_168205 [Aaosphaeria arxii CBS 175.79]KAF2018305.1 hypothetical protein BU24DRAFT_168205 [Aaosphaeria arxii CBS 175.79]
MEGSTSDTDGAGIANGNGATDRTEAESKQNGIGNTNGDTRKDATYSATTVTSPLLLNANQASYNSTTAAQRTENGRNEDGTKKDDDLSDSSKRATSSKHVRMAEHLQRPHLAANHRSLSDAMRAVRSREEQETLLTDDEIADPDGCLREDSSRLGPREVFHPDPHSALDVYYTIHRVRRLVLASIDDPYSIEQMKEPRMNVLIVKPLVDRLYDEDDVSVVYCLLVNRMQFLHEQSFQPHHQSVNLTRANLCELVALKMLRLYDEDKSGRPGLLRLANILVAPFQPFQNAPPEVCPERSEWHYQKQGGYEGKLTALEVAIVSESKLFLSSSASQKIIDAVYRGRIVYTPTAFLDIIPDHYKHKPISLYDPRKAPLLNQYRLIVPRNRNIIEVVQFIVLLGLYCLCMMNRDSTANSNFTAPEAWFMVYAAGWVLDECLSVLEHGWVVHTQELWAFLDLTFVFIYWLYFILRIYGFVTGDAEAGRQALDILAIASPVVFPRLAFNLMPENMLFISLRAMVKEFTALTLIAVWCFGGFLLALKWLSMGNPNIDFADSPAPVTISKWMLWIWFGLDGTGIQQAPRFHEVLGPTLMVIYAFLGNTLFLTVLVSILSNTFSKIAASATAEIQFRRAVTTFEGVKSDSLFAYRPPFNILALFILLPLKFFLTPRWFHKINITLVRILNAPILLLIALYERKYLWNAPRPQRTLGPSKRETWSIWSWKSFSPHSDLQKVFEEEPPQSVCERIEEQDELEDAILEQSFAGTGVGQRGISPGSFRVGGRRRRLSSVWHE